MNNEGGFYSSIDNALGVNYLNTDDYETLQCFTIFKEQATQKPKQ